MPASNPFRANDLHSSFYIPRMILITLDLRADLGEVETIQGQVNQGARL